MRQYGVQYVWKKHTKQTHCDKQNITVRDTFNKGTLYSELFKHTFHLFLKKIQSVSGRIQWKGKKEEEDWLAFLEVQKIGSKK